VAVGTHGNGVFESYYSGNTPPAIYTYGNSSLYPNPANDKIYFSFDATGTTSYRAEVYDISGRRVDGFTNGINNNGVFTQVVDVSAYPTGHYFVTFYTSGKRKQVQHFLVQH
jgi:hypothetical protein